MFDNVDDALWCWETIFKDVISRHVTTGKVNVRTDSQPWMNREIRKEVIQRFKLFNKAKSTDKGSIERKRCRKARNTCTSLICKAKANYWRSKFQSCGDIK